MTDATRATKTAEPTKAERITIRNINRLNALAGKLQWECHGEEKKSIDDAIDFLFDFWEKRREKNES